MANEKKLIDEWSVRDLEDNSSLTVQVYSCTELGNQSKPGIQILTMGRFTNYEPLAAERWAYQAGKEGVTEFLLKDNSWLQFEDQYIKIYYVTGEKPKAKVEVKTRSSKPTKKEYELPFGV